MINNEMHKVQVNTLSETTDSYGQRRRTVTCTYYIDMFIKLYTQTNINNPIYTDVEAIGLTNDNLVNDKQQIVDGNITYNILKVIPSSRYTQVLLKKVK